MDDKATIGAAGIIAVDFDGTIVEHEYPIIGRPVPGAMDSLFLRRKGIGKL